MLLRYIVSNFKSIGHPIEFSMLPSNHQVDKKYLKSIHTKAGDWSILKRGAFFGPNASGKTSFIQSLQFARNLIVKGRRSSSGTGVSIFRGDFADLGHKAVFQFMFYIAGEVYEYGFSLDEIQVYEEWLTILDSQEFVPMFTRITDEEGETQIEIGEMYAAENSKERGLAEILKESIQEEQKNQLFLYKLYDNGSKKVRDIIYFFKNMQVIFPNTKVRGLPIKISKDADFQEFVSKSLNKLDTGVSSVSVVSDEIDFLDYADKINLPREIIDDIEEVKNGIVSIGGKYFIFAEKDTKKTVMLQIQFAHLLNEKLRYFNMDDESDGTQRLLDLLPILFSMDKKNTTIYFIDELDRSLHTKLSKYFLHQFLMGAQETYNQMIFTAHDVNLIDMNAFAQDEIWFVEKNNAGETMIRPFSDFDLKAGQDVLKSYLAGRFGAVPMIRED